MTPRKIPGNWSVFKDITQKALNFLKIRKFTDESKKLCKIMSFISRAAVLHLNFRAESTFPVPVCTVPHGHWLN